MSETKCGGEFHAFLGQKYTGTSSWEQTKHSDEELAKWIRGSDEKLKCAAKTVAFSFSLYSFDITCHFYEDHDLWVDVTCTRKYPSWFPEEMQKHSLEPYTDKTGWGIETRTPLVQVQFHADTSPTTRKQVGWKAVPGATAQPKYEFSGGSNRTFHLDAVDCETGSLRPQRLRQDLTTKSTQKFRHVIELTRVG
ncbi:hypothetical protein [Streptomyces sp. NPDC093589]|uniref:hypothetical protein n=1 Tax=Streptomyces sp. NPDC093589 TaxID=3366043 RepID=UPI003818D93D